MSAKAKKKKAVKTVARSPAEFFADNKSIAGFDNPGKSTFTTVREFVENSLDAAEEGQILPNICIMVDKISKKTARPNLYGSPTKAKATSFDDMDVDAPPSSSKGKSKSSKAAVKADQSYFKITVRDNAVGMPHEEIPNLLGRVLSGTKYGVKQSRGRFGLGAKMALIWSKMTTAGELVIYSAERGSSYVTFCKLDIDLHKNEPKILALEKFPNDGSLKSESGLKLHFPPNWHGTEISVMFEGNWVGNGAGMKARANVIKYIRQLAVITPYADFELHYTCLTKDTDKDLKVKFKRRSSAMPEIPRTVPHHPSSVGLTKIEELLRLAGEKTKSTTLKKFLRDSFAFITTPISRDIIESLGPKFDEDMDISELTQPLLMHIQKTLRSREWPKPDGKALSPAGAYNMYLGIIKEFNPDLVVTTQEAPRVYEGHAFIVEAAVSLGGKTLGVGINPIRFANRIPLIFEPGSDVVTKSSHEDIRWVNYKMNPKEDKIGVYVSIVSTKIPFKGTGKEFISSDCDEIRDCVKSALQKCCGQLKVKILKRQKENSQRGRKKELLQYIPHVAKAVFNVLQSVDVEAEADLLKRQRKRPPLKAMVEEEEEEPPTKRLKAVPTAGDDEARLEVLDLIESDSLKVSRLSNLLEKHVRQCDATEALEFINQQGRPNADVKSDDVYIAKPVATSEFMQLKISGISFSLPRRLVVE